MGLKLSLILVLTKLQV